LDTADSVHIIFDVNHTRRAYLPEETMGCWAGN
jgi:hypothetical protein